MEFSKKLISSPKYIFRYKIYKYLCTSHVTMIYKKWMIRSMFSSQIVVHSFMLIIMLRFFHASIKVSAGTPRLIIIRVPIIRLSPMISRSIMLIISIIISGFLVRLIVLSVIMMSSLKIILISLSIIMMSSLKIILISLSVILMTLLGIILPMSAVIRFPLSPII